MESKTDIRNAKKWACNVRTIRNWRLAGAPLGNPKAMLNWLASRKHIGPGTLALLQKKRAAIIAMPLPTDEPQSEGVGGALKRLEGQERKSYQELVKAQAAGDPILTKIAHATWMKNGESLRRYDLAIEQSRRDSGQLIPQDEMLRLIWILKDALYFSLLKGLEGVCNDLAGLRTPTDVWVILSKMKDIVHGAAIGWLQMGRKQPVPAWMVKAFAEGQFPCGGDGEEDYTRFGYAMRTGMEAAGAEIRAEIDKKQKKGAA